MAIPSHRNIPNVAELLNLAKLAKASMDALANLVNLRLIGWDVRNSEESQVGQAPKDLANLDNWAGYGSGRSQYHFTSTDSPFLPIPGFEVTPRSSFARRSVLSLCPASVAFN